MYKNDKGFSLVEVMIAAGILGFVTLATSALMIMIAETGAKARFENDVVNDLDRLRTLLNKEHICTTNLKGKKLTNTLSQPFNLFEVKKTSSDTYVKDTKNLSDLNADVRLQLDPSSKLAILKFKFTPKVKITGPNELYRDIFLYATVDSSNNITECSASGKTRLGSCYERGGYFGVHVTCQKGEVVTKVCSAGRDPDCIAPANTIMDSSNTRDGFMKGVKSSRAQLVFTVLTCCKLE